MTLSITKHKKKNGKIYYDLWDQRRIKGKVVRKYVGYIGTSSNAKQEISAKQLMAYIERLLRIGISDAEISSILSKMGIKTDIWPLTKLIIEHDRKLNKIFLRFK